MEKKHQIVGWMSVAMFLSYLPWYNFSAVLKDISREMALTAADTGEIIAAFQAGYVLVVLGTGWLADRIGVRRVLMGATLMTAVCTTLFVFVVHDKATVMVMRMLTGCAAGAVYVPGMALLTNWFPPQERGGALGMYTGALTAASAGSYFIAGPLSALYGWRLGMLATSLPAFLAVGILWWLVQERPRAAIQYDGPEVSSVAPVGGYGGPAVITFSYMGHMWELYAFWAWIGPFMVACAGAGGVAADRAVQWGGMMAAAVTLAGVPAVWMMGKLADKVGRTRTILLCATCSMAAELFFGYLIGLSLGWVVFWGIWIGFWAVADSAVYKAGLTDMVSEKIRGTVLGIQSAAGFAMTIAAPLVFGRVLQWYNGTGDPTAAIVWGPAFVSLGIGALLAPAAALLLRRVPQSRLMAGGKR